MSCWTRHLVDVMAAAGIENNPANKKIIDKYVKEKFGLGAEVRCPEVKKLFI